MRAVSSLGSLRTAVRTAGIISTCRSANALSRRPVSAARSPCRYATQVLVSAAFTGRPSVQGGSEKIGLSPEAGGAAQKHAMRTQAATRCERFACYCAARLPAPFPAVPPPRGSCSCGRSPSMLILCGGWRLARAVLPVEDLLDGFAENGRDLERQRQARIVAAGFDGVDRLARDSQPLGEIRLGPVAPGAQHAKFVRHRCRRARK